MSEPGFAAATDSVPVAPPPLPDLAAANGDRNRGFWRRLPLYGRIVVAIVIGAILGLVLRQAGVTGETATEAIRLPATLTLRALRALATPLVLFAVLNAFITTEIKGREGGRLFVLLITNTLAAILIGLLVVNVLRPGDYVPRLRAEIAASNQRPDPSKRLGPLDIPESVVPESLLQPFTQNDVLKLILPAIAFGIALRRFKERQIRAGQTGYRFLERGVAVGFELILEVLHWVIAVVPLAVLCVVASVVARQGLRALLEFSAFILVVLVALLVQLAFYLLRIRLQTRTSPLRVLGGVRDALATAFSTSSSTVTMPITYANLVEKVRLRPKSASLGALVGSNFNNDGTALYEAVAALFIAQAIGQNLSVEQQFFVVLTSIVASVGAAGIPEAGLVTMTLVFTAVGLPTSAILFLVSVDWFLDRCRTALNVMGDVTVATILDEGERREGTPAVPAPAPALGR